MSVEDMPMDMEGLGLTDEQLEALAGGKLEGDDLEPVLRVMRIFKERGWTKTRFVSEYASVLMVSPEELGALADQHWDSF